MMPFFLTSAASLFAAPGGADSGAPLFGDGQGQSGLTLIVLGVVALGLGGVAALLSWQAVKLKAQVRSQAGGGSTAPAQPLAIVNKTDAPTPDIQQRTETLATSQLIIRDLVSDLKQLVGSMIERSATHANKMEGYKVSIQQAMTVAGVEEIERLLLGEIAEMQEANARSQAELEQANARIREQETVLENLQSDANTDFLTQLANRRSIETALETECSRAERYGNPISVIMIDIDLFKTVNDTHGHAVGDKVIQTVAHVMEVSIRQTDQAGRYGGEEFLILLPETKLASAKLVAEKIRAAVEAAGYKHGRTLVRVTISAGVGEYRHGEGRDAFVTRVDQALYTAKQEGRNRIKAAS